MPLPSPQGAPVVVLLGPVGVGKSLLATALAGLPPSNRIFKVGDSAQAVTLEAVCHRCRWFGRASEEELVLVDPPGVGDGEKDTTRLAQVVRLLRDLGSVSLFVVVLNSEQPRIGSVLENLLRLMEECFGRRFWRHVALVFTRYYTDARSARRRGSKTKDMLRDEFSMALATQFPHSQQERTLAADPFPSYFVDSEAAINNELPEAERAAALMELERLSVFARASPCLPTGTDDNTSVGSSTARGREPDTEQECSEDHFATGSWVEIHGLVGTPSLNGMRALVVEFQSQRHRYTVELSNGSRKLIHAKNLQSITETMTDPPEAPHLASGMYCSISGLSGATHLNGQKCLVVSRKDGRYEVQLLDGSLKSIKPVNLTPLPKPPVGERVTVKNAIEGAMVQRGLDWIWNDQDGGDGCVGRIQAIEGDWACVQWNSGRANKYRIGADGSCDLIYVDEFKHENACRKALQRGKSHVEPRHLSRTFAYLHGTRCANVDFFDIRDEVCQAVGGCKHGQRVQVKGMQAVAIGVATLPSPLPHLAQKLEMFFHVERAEGAGIFDEADGIQMRVVGRQRVREAKRPIGTNNQELMEVAKMVKPSFQYMWGPNSYLGMTLERFDVRDEVCVKVGGFKHGQLVKVADKVAVVIGVRLMRGIPKLFFHLDGKPGSGTFDDLSTQQIVLVGTRKVEETADDFLEEPALSPEVEALAGKLECTFSFPLGNPFSKPARFDIRDNVCRAVGGFCHGQVVSDGDGDKAVVVGVKKSDGRPRLFFRAEGNRGAGRFNPYHLYRKELRVVGKQKLQEVSPSDPIFHRPEEGARMEKLLEALLAGAKRSQQRTPHSQPSGLPSDFEFDYSFHYLQKSCDPAFFDIRDEVCMAVGGYRHGDVVQHGFVDRKSVVIGVRPDDEGVPHLWMHRDGAAGASIFREMELLRMTSTVVGRKTVAEFEEPERDFSPEFIAGLQFTFNYPMGLRGRSRPGLFDIRDEVCLAVGGFKHGDRIKWGRTELAVVGVMLEKGLPEMHFQIVKPKSRVGAGMFRNFHLMKQHVKLVGSQTLEEVVLDDSDPTGMSPTRCSSTDSSEPEMDSESSSESESQRAPSRKMSRQASEASEAAHNGGKDGSARALVLRLSHSNSQVKNVLLTSKELDDCRRDVAEDGCEVTPEWANGAILLVPLTQEQARQARLELRSHHVVIFPGDKGRLLNALGALPCRQRPRIRGDEEYDLAASAAREATEDVQAHMAEGLEEGLVLRVDRTFWTFVAPASEFSVNESAPCRDGESRQPRNPRQVA